MSTLLMHAENGPKRAVFFSGSEFFTIGISANAAGVKVPIYYWQPLSKDANGQAIDPKDPASPPADWAPCVTNSVPEELELGVNNPRTIYGRGWYLADIPAATGITIRYSGA